MFVASAFGLPAEDWSAIAACVTAVVASVALVAVGLQLREARTLRLAQAQPYVVVALEPSPAGDWVIDLVVRNLGTTAALDVTLSIEPAPCRAAGGGDRQVLFPPRLPTLVPGQEWRTLWDTLIARGESELPDQHTATVTFVDAVGGRHVLTFALDFGPLKQRDVVTVRTMHDVGVAARDVAALLKGFKEGSAGLKVIARDGDARDRRIRTEARQRRAEREGRVARNWYRRLARALRH
jgi:hypothetical protein